MKTTTYNPFWKGTTIPKSRGNAFDWKGKESQVAQSTEIKNINKVKLQKISLTRK